MLVSLRADRLDNLERTSERGHYLRYATLVAHVLEREGRSVASLLRAPPDASAVEARVRAAHPGSAR